MVSSADISDAALVETLADLKRGLQEDVAQHRRLVTIVDLTSAKLLNAKQRVLLNDWFKDTRDMTRVSSLGVVFIAPSAVLRGVLTAIFWFQTFGAPHGVAANLSEAVAWALARLTDAGVSLKPDIRAAIERAWAPKT